MVGSQTVQGHRYRGGAREATAPHLDTNFALKYLKKEAKLGKNGQKWSICPPPPLEGESKIRTPPRGCRIYVPASSYSSKITVNPVI